jgi:hypothetical protein
MRSADLGQGCDADSTLSVLFGGRGGTGSHMLHWVEAIQDKSRGCITKADAVCALSSG